MSYIDRIRERLAVTPDPDAQRLLETHQVYKSLVDDMSRYINDLQRAAEYSTPKAWKEAQAATPGGATLDVWIKAWFAAVIRDGVR